MAVNSGNGPSSSTEEDDPLLPWLWSIRKELDNKKIDSSKDTKYDELVSNCINTFKHEPRYKDDIRFLQIWFLYLDVSSDYVGVFSEIDKYKICVREAMLYESFAHFFELKGRYVDASEMYNLGISRNAEPLGRLKKAQVLFLERMSERVTNGSLQKAKISSQENLVNPWSVSTLKSLLQKMDSQVLQYEGYHSSKKAYPGKVGLYKLLKSSRNKTIDIGGKKYQIKGCAGQGGFAQVFKAFVNGNPDDVVSLKIQKPPFPWEFYMYRQLDMRIPEKERMSFGYAHRMHLYTDYSVLVSDFLAHGTLQDAINYNVIASKSMDEVLCIYYTIEMLQMLETLHSSSIIHGDFKPDNLLIRYSREDPTEDKNDILLRTGPWHEQGLCLVDWGRGIDLSLFPENTKFNGDSRTSGFRCIEMQESKPWTYQVDIYGLCVTVHVMLHNAYMEIEKRTSPDGSYVYLPKAQYKRYWNVSLWKDLFTKLLNLDPSEDHKELLRSLRVSFQEYMCSDQKLIKKLKQLLMKQRTSLCSA